MHLVITAGEHILGCLPLEKRLSFSQYLLFLYGKIFFPGKQSEKGRLISIRNTIVFPSNRKLPSPYSEPIDFFKRSTFCLTANILMSFRQLNTNRIAYLPDFFRII